ncbi:MAG: UDP-glucose 6-dehydrogenase [Crocinitomicaceae bacterium]|jgi:UDPglucose 6-dehydrogenase|nr:UDP-glucose 6-dehydrogenase [Crocinitomicaceae bacterium]|tara:strand:+ start:1523 stop:2839 length:1317 start_codon:yes stop_codon:yes gene_type:complete
MKIAVVGTGYVGLVSGTCFAETGNDVVCVDIDEAKVASMKEGKIPIYEPHLDVLFERNIQAGRLTFTTNLESAIEEATLIFLALPTPPGEDGSADLSYVLGVAGHLGKIIKDYKVIIDKSTVPVGTADKVHAAVAENAQVDFDVVSNPEFLREGFAVDDFMKPDRVVIGCSSARAEKLMSELYKPFVRQGNPILFMDEKSAELTKYAANSFLATKITFMNEVANFCELVGADVDKVRRGMGTDTRIGSRFLFPGIGYGGSCFPKDVQALHRSGQEAQFDFGILTSVMRANEDQKTVLFDPIRDYFEGNLQGKRIALWGLAFKPETDDIREAPALYMIDRLVDAGADIIAFDPEAMDNVKERIGDKIDYADNHLEALNGADALLICTEWQVFRNPDMNDVKQRLNNPVVFDGRNLYELDGMRDLNFYYKSIGRSTIHPV